MSDLDISQMNLVVTHVTRSAKDEDKIVHRDVTAEIVQYIYSLENRLRAIERLARRRGSE